LDAWLSLDFIAKRYGVLPSVALATGYDTDIICANIAVGYESYLANKHKDGADPSKATPTQEEMLAMIERVKVDKNSIKTKSDILNT
jgi:hypothetical protein